MVHILTRSQIEDVSAVLGQEFTASPTSSVSRPVLYYQMRNYLEGRLSIDCSFAVDKWPDYRAIMGVESMETTEPPSLILHWNDEEGLKSLLKDDSLINWKRYMAIAFLPISGLPIVEKAIKEKGVVVSQMMKSFMANYIKNSAPVLESVAMDDITVGPLSPEHTQLVNQTWEFGGSDETAPWIRHQLSTFISGCVMDKQGNPLSWVSVDQYGQSNFGFTLPEHRRKGYYSLAKQYCIQKCLEAGHDVFAHIVEDNEASLKAHKKLGYMLDERADGVFVFLNMPTA